MNVEGLRFLPDVEIRYIIRKAREFGIEVE